MLTTIFKKNHASDVLLETEKVMVVETPGNELCEQILDVIGKIRADLFLGDSGISHDLDHYDQHFNHLFCIDKEKENVISYSRMGVVKNIFPKFGKDGFYLSSIYNVDDCFYEKLGDKVIEVGRVLINPEYRHNPHAVKYLWQGYIFFLNKHNCDSFYGTISINNSFSHDSFKLISRFLEVNYNTPEFSDLISPKKHSFTNEKDLPNDLKEIYSSIKLLKKQLQVIENRDVDIPSLIRHYISWSDVHYICSGGIPEGIDANTIVLLCKPNNHALIKFGSVN